MGMFDEVVFVCYKCGEAISVQSKAGDCYLNEYTRHAVPIKIAADVIGDRVRCDTCNAEYEIFGNYPRVAELFLVPIKD